MLGSRVARASNRKWGFDGRMHRTDSKRPPNLQDKRSVVPIELEDVDSWLFGTVGEASALIRLPDLKTLDAAPMPK